MYMSFDAALSWHVRTANLISDGGSGIKIGPDWKMARTGGSGIKFPTLGAGILIPDPDRAIFQSRTVSGGMAWGPSIGEQFARVQELFSVRTQGSYGHACL